MRTTFFPLSFLLAFLVAPLCFPAASFALNLHRNVPTTTRDMEYFYLHKRAESVPGMLRSLDKNGRFAQGELRLVTAAFLAEFFNLYPNEAPNILKLADQLSYDAQRMFLWAAHLTTNQTFARALTHLKAAHDKTLLLQLELSPRELSQWDICQSSAVLHMYWGAFFVAAGSRYLDRIIDAVLLHARLKARGLVQDPRYKSSMEVAASLYEMTPRHEAIRKRLEERLKTLSGAEAETIGIILKARK